MLRELDEYSVDAFKSALAESGEEKAKQLPAIIFSICEENFGLVAKQKYCIPNVKKRKSRTKQRALGE